MAVLWSRVLLFIFCMLCGSVLSQASSSQVRADREQNGTLRVRVTDSQGRSVSRASCSLVPASEPNKIVSTAETDTDGVASFPNLPAGEYVLKVESTGFETFTNNRVVIKSSEVAEVKVVLAIADVSASVTVKSPDELTTSVQSG